MAKFVAAEYKERLKSTVSCDKCEKVPAIKLGPKDSYIFISYSHKDYKQVYADLADLYESHVPFWYDEGLPAGKNWDDVVRERMTDPRCAGVIFFLSENLFLSESIQTEIHIALGEDGDAQTPQIKKEYFCVNLSDKSPSKILKSVYPDKEFPDTEDEMAAQNAWVNTLTKAFPDKATYLPFDNPSHKDTLIQQISGVFGINPNYNPYSFGSASFLSGKAVIKFESGAVYDGEFMNSLFEGHGKLTQTDGSSYTGEWKDGKRHGQGAETHASGAYYVGGFVDGKKQGRGTYTWPDGTVYNGECKDNQMHGQGTMTYPNGALYIGEYKEHKMHGQGSLTYPDGATYVGEWKHGKKHGQGTYTRPDGMVYEGEWKGGKRHGQGSLTYPNGTTYVGGWKDGKSHGQGTETYSNGDFYTGEYKDGKKHGHGTYTYHDGRTYTGEWKNRTRHGQGTMTFPDGTKQTGRFENGVFVGEEE